MNELIRPKKRWKQKLLLFFLVIVPLSFILFQLFTIREPIMDFSKAVLDPDIYNNALVIAEKDPRVRALLGNIDPIDIFMVLEGDFRYTDNNTAIKMTVGLKGSKNKGKLDVKATKKSNNWEYQFIRVRIKKPQKKEVIVLNQS